MLYLLQLSPHLARKVSNGEIAFAQAQLENEKARNKTMKAAKNAEVERKAKGVDKADRERKGEAVVEERVQQTHPLDRSIFTAMATKLVHTS